MVLAGGYFNIFHRGHIRYLREAKRLGDRLIVHVHRQRCSRKHKGYAVLTTADKVEILEAFSFVDDVWVCTRKCDGTIVEALERVRKEYPDCQIILAKGGDRTPENMPKSEIEACKRLNIEIVYGVGGGKVASSSWYLKT
ncbi:MAG: adenylyltransferase/cytidyltransferase family protein [Candidatus Bathyarchaeia archaeon]